MNATTREPRLPWLQACGFGVIVLVTTLIPYFNPWLAVPCPSPQGTVFPDCLTLPPDGTPCLMQSAFAVIPQNHFHPTCIDRYQYWELAALAQTLLVSLVLFAETEDKNVTRVFAFCFFLGLLSLLFYLHGIVVHDWQTQLISVTSFLVILTVEDWLIFRKQTDRFHQRLCFHTLCFADLPILLGTATLSLWLRNDESREGHVFFAGASALSLIVSNVLVFAFRLDVYFQWSDRLLAWATSRKSPGQ